MKTLVVKPIGGLANRMRVVESAYDFAKKYDARLVIAWEKNDDLNAGYFDCFEKAGHIRIVETDRSGKTFLAKLKRKVFAPFDWILRHTFSGISLNDATIEPVLKDGPQAATAFFDELAAREKYIYLETCFNFYPQARPFRLVVRKEIQKKAEALLVHHSPVIGVHIRRTDNQIAIENSPLEMYVQSLEEALQQDPGVCFYISTDAEDVVAFLRKIYGTKIITGVTVRRRDTSEGIIAALIDLCCLSRCQRILGSYYSSFSVRAAEMGNIPLKIISL